MKENRVPRRMKHTTIAHGPIAEKMSVPGRERKDELGSGSGTYPLQQMGSSGSAIAAAASQAIAATQLVPGRRSSSLKASYEAINLGVARHEFSIGSDLATAANSALAATSTDLGQGGQGGMPNQALNRVKHKQLKLPKTATSTDLGQGGQ